MDADRYARQIQMDYIGVTGQRRLMKSCAVIVGAGALGTASSSFLVRSGVGRVVMIDDDGVEVSNLQRQTLFTENDVGRPKVEAALEHLRAINSQVDIRGHFARLTEENIADLLCGADVVLDAVDNIETRELINFFCVKKAIPWIYGGVAGGCGMTMNIVPSGPCFKCLMPFSPPKSAVRNAATEGILSAVPGFIASLQCTEAIKILCHGYEHETVRKGLLYADLINNVFELHEVRKLPGCIICGGNIDGD